MSQESQSLLDLEQMRALAELDDGAGYLRELFALFADDAQQALRHMSELLRRGDAQSLVREAHRLKGSSGSIGAAELSRCCLEIEYCARGLRGTEVDLTQCISLAQRRLDETLSAVRRRLG
jgi:HPt (histidine-containing phosphotransfer) domain-containing protein